jgi:hypothetical protein
MSRPPDTLSKEELEEFSRRLSMLSVQGIEQAYQMAYAECRFDGKKLPPPAAVQQMVATWKMLRKIHA